ncbi:hypothetical protein ABEB36_015071 [Hypothenemus hampei]|uniref:MADF domain-containing protein n=1 Tax=Hypothenemus hampei TaxID=57062 RepID=A0ABD1E0N1_HYPHA
MVFKWKDDHTSLILTLMQNRPCLWNTKVEEYKHKSKRETALKEILEELNLSNEVTVEDLKAKIKTIRTRYSSELAKVKDTSRSGAGTQDFYVPKLFWFKQADSFLRIVCLPRKSSASANINAIRDDVFSLYL